MPHVFYSADQFPECGETRSADEIVSSPASLDAMSGESPLSKSYLRSNVRYQFIEEVLLNC
ncbi:unnamed protein product [Clavelina lepadiformis]|uniref:Uncharacterized protein n=1 Tax=Clavelina lepadiformis TaxID=159417 RepID=A0ABP0EZG5_CLALP